MYNFSKKKRKKEKQVYNVETKETGQKVIEGLAKTIKQ